MTKKHPTLKNDKCHQNRKSESIAWRKGSMMFEFAETDSTFAEKIVSKKNEPPSEFIKRVISKSKNLNGDAVWGYLTNSFGVRK